MWKLRLLEKWDLQISNKNSQHGVYLPELQWGHTGDTNLFKVLTTVDPDAQIAASTLP
jgi:hypothetical protein